MLLEILILDCLILDWLKVNEYLGLCLGTDEHTTIFYCDEGIIILFLIPLILFWILFELRVVFWLDRYNELILLVWLDCDNG